MDGYMWAILLGLIIATVGQALREIGAIEDSPWLNDGGRIMTILGFLLIGSIAVTRVGCV